MNGGINNLDQIRALVMGNMPRTIVHTGRQPATKGLKDVIKSFLMESDEENGIIEEDVMAASARAFRDAEDDRAAAAALGVLYSEAKKRSDERSVRVVAETESFILHSRPDYIREIIDLTKDHSYEPLLEASLFIERAVRSGGNDLNLIVKQLESLYVFKGDPIPTFEEAGQKRLDDTAGWFDLICKKLITRCESYLKDKDNGRDKPPEGEITDRVHIERILAQTKDDRKAFVKVIKKLKEEGYDKEVITWADAINEEVQH